jgi:hypothetical protein
MDVGLGGELKYRRLCHTVRLAAAPDERLQLLYGFRRVKPLPGFGSTLAGTFSTMMIRPSYSTEYVTRRSTA